MYTKSNDDATPHQKSSNLALRRDLLSLAQKIIHDAQHVDPESNADEVIDAALDRLAALRRYYGLPGFRAPPRVHFSDEYEREVFCDARDLTLCGFAL